MHETRFDSNEGKTYENRVIRNTRSCNHLNAPGKQECGPYTCLFVFKFIIIIFSVVHFVFASSSLLLLLSSAETPGLCCFC